MKRITTRQYATLVFLQDFTVANGRPPYPKEIAFYFGISSQAVVDRIKRLAQQGYVDYKPRFPVRVLHVPGMAWLREAA